LNTYILFKSVLIAVYQKLLKLVHACRNYSLPNLAHFFETQCTPQGVLVHYTDAAVRASDG